MLLVGSLEASEHFGAFLLFRNVHPALSIHTSVSIHTFRVPAQLRAILLRNTKTLSCDGVLFPLQLTQEPPGECLVRASSTMLTCLVKVVRAPGTGDLTQRSELSAVYSNISLA